MRRQGVGERSGPGRGKCFSAERRWCLLPRGKVFLTVALAGTLTGLPWYSAQAQEPWNVPGQLTPGVPHAHGLVEPTRIWPGLKIDVCWEQAYPQFTAERAWVRQALEETIEEGPPGSHYDLTGSPWEVCDQRPRQRIQVVVEDLKDKDGRPIGGNSDVGVQTPYSAFLVSVPQPTRVRLNFTFQNGFDDDCKGSEAERKTCIQDIAVHEFMHALGFLHEQYNTNLREADPDCYNRIKDTMVKDKDTVPDNNTWYITKYDPDSIMNYCNLRFTSYSRPPRLSEMDKLSLAEVVGASRAKVERQ